MHLSSITIKGFKSFPERTKLEFSPGVSVIVGPNGCGKSNVTDAVLWALGEQSPLSVRGQSMQDMVYAGGDGIGPSRYAEVEVVLDNDDGGDEEFSEISIQRRLERGGEGSYRINGARARLADVVDVLADASLGREMHSVISQGRVEEIVLSAPRERRLLVEEAAGLGKHRKRRRRAQLKLERTQDNLDRALDVEREARSRLRPLKRQAQAADIHARLERESAELRGRLLAAELGALGSEAAGAARLATEARAVRDGLDQELGELNARRTAIEERLAARDRERTEAWGRLTAVRAAHERLTVRAEALGSRRVELAGALERRRAALGALATELAETVGAGAGADPVAAGLERIATELGAAGEALEAARAGGSDADRGRALAGLRAAAERAGQVARRIEEMLGSRRQDSLADQLEGSAAILAALELLCEAAADARDAAGERAAALERRMLSGGGADDVSEALRACSRADGELQSKLRAAGEAVTAAEVRATQLADRRAELAGELERVAAVLGRELEPAELGLTDDEREQIEAKLERLARRREQLGPVNPLAEREYEEALAHVEALETQRNDLETALAELGSLIRETDRTIDAAFERTFEATRQNFGELVEHLFPGGRGRLRLVDDARGPKPVLGGGDQADSGEAPDGGGGDVGRRAERRRSLGGTRGRDRGDSRGQGDPAAEPALRRREGAGGAGLRLLGVPRPALALLHPRRGRGGSRRREHRPLPAARAPVQRPGPVHHRYPPEADHGRGRGPLRRLDGQGRRHQGGLATLRSAPAAAQRGGRSGLSTLPLAMEWEQLVHLPDDSSASRPGPPQEGPARAGRLERLRERLGKSRRALRAELSASLFDRLDAETWERLEEALILADVGARATADVVGRLETEVEAGEVVGAEAIEARLVELLADLAGAGEPRLELTGSPAVIMVVGVNGTGKTTTIGKLASVLSERFGLSVIVAAADTYRAAAIEQLETWAERAGSEIVRGNPGGDPGAVVFDALAAAEARDADVVIVDTAGRLHTHGGLMDELAKVNRVAAKRLGRGPDETLIVIDATTGQNGLRQARAFADSVELTGVALTKLDGTAKGGIALAIAGELELPVKLIGVGETLDDLRPFDPREFAGALLSQ